MLEDAKKYHAELVERIVENDEATMNAYLEGNEPPLAELKALIRKAVIANEVFPVFAGSALKNKGVQLVLDAVVDYLPAPIDIKPVTGTDPETDEVLSRSASDSEPFAALAFKSHERPIRRPARVLPCVFRNG